MVATCRMCTEFLLPVFGNTAGFASDFSHYLFAILSKVREHRHISTILFVDDRLHNQCHVYSLTKAIK